MPRSPPRARPLGEPALRGPGPPWATPGALSGPAFPSDVAGDGPPKAQRRTLAVAARRAAKAAARPAVVLAARPSLARETIVSRLRARTEFLAALRVTRDELLCWEEAAVDAALVDFGQFLYDQGRSLGDFKDAIFGVRAYRTQWRRAFPCAWDSAWEWVALEPGERHPPLPRVVFAALVSLALLWRWWAVVVQLLLGFCGGARPGEACSRKRKHVILPRDVGLLDDTFGDVEAAEWVAYVAFPYTPGEGDAPKLTSRRKGSQHTTIEDPDAVGLLDLCLRHLSDEAPLWPASPGVLRDRIGRLCRAVGVPWGGTGLTCASLRAGCATELWRQTKDLSLCQWHLRHSDLRTLGHYIQELPAALVRARLPPAALRGCRRLEAALPGLVEAAHAGRLGGVFWHVSFLASARRVRPPPPRRTRSAEPRPAAVARPCGDSRRRQWSRELSGLGLEGLGPAWQLRAPVPLPPR